MELLWGLESRPRRGPKPRFTLEDVIGAAIGIADGEGLEALSMRRVAERLGVTAMSLYGYVPGKAELIDLMVDRAIGEAEMPDDVPGGWRARLEQVARASRAVYVRHPWLLQAVTARSVLGPNIIGKYDHELRAIADTGLGPIEMDLVVTMISDYVHGSARSAVEAAQAAQRTGKTDEEWWEEYEPLLKVVFDAERFPHAAVVGQAAGQEYGSGDPDRSFEFGLRLILDGIEALVERAT
ncbi:TetR/AcrR family transcriptional regulator [Bailinhaonella thermotolerans]|uniref:TetR/AcrR family transcriptional regulator n=2 Tax=Bailinhaonella thermotolerans TaxID=1070861 RepID=A0A3A4BAA0_9ACTN|nr:TetR/AcrR family transcriptional regulator [Bailinhaonella thermotolerans]